MGLPSIYIQPESEDEWTAWSFNHAGNHYDILQAAFTSKGQNLNQYILDPMNPDDLGTWLYQHQVTHNQINALLGTQGNDLLNLDWRDPEQFASWLRLNGDEHVRISAALGIG